MKRLITCAALMLFAAGVFTVTRGLVVRAGDVEPTAPPTRDQFASEEAWVAFRDGPAEQPENPFADFSGDAQRQQLLERTKAKIELMSDEQVQQALEATDAEIRTMQAKQELDQTAEILRRIVTGFEGTPSAGTALAMIQLYENQGRPTPASDDFGTNVDDVLHPLPDDASDFSPSPQDNERGGF